MASEKNKCKFTLEDLKREIPAYQGFDAPYDEIATEETLDELTNNKRDDEDE